MHTLPFRSITRRPQKDREIETFSCRTGKCTSNPLQNIDDKTVYLVERGWADWREYFLSEPFNGRKMLGRADDRHACFEQREGNRATGIPLLSAGKTNTRSLRQSISSISKAEALWRLSHCRKPRLRILKFRANNTCWCCKWYPCKQCFRCCCL